MINNNFLVIGYCLTDFEPYGNASKILRLEVEKVGAKSGNTFELLVQVFNNNRAINTSASVIGRLVAVNGYLDTIPGENGRIFLKAIAQNLIIVDKDKKKEPNKALAGSEIEVDLDEMGIE